MNEKFLHKKSLGQHFLTSPVVPGWMCDVAEIKKDEVVVEIGPGTGVLTKTLLERGATVIALEADKRAVAILEETYKEAIDKKQLLVKHVDIRTVDLGQLLPTTTPYKVVSNIPYYLTGLLFRLFLTHYNQPTAIVFLIQKEVAKRITVQERLQQKHSLLSLSVHAYGTPTYIKTVSRGHFTPSPKVDSAIVLVGNISRTCFSHCSETLFFDILHQGFGQKRKQLLRNLQSKFKRETLEEIFTALSLSLTVRAEDVTLASWQALTRELEKHTSENDI